MHCVCDSSCISTVIFCYFCIAKLVANDSIRVYIARHFDLSSIIALTIVYWHFLTVANFVCVRFIIHTICVLSINIDGMNIFDYSWATK